MKERDSIVLIPALDPEDTLLLLLQELKKSWQGPMVVVDDGSQTIQGKEILKKIEKMNIHVLHHAVNLGKGRALKTGINYCLLQWPEAAGIVTADADGQHLAKDILRCRDKMIEEKALILGCRDFSGKSVPWKSSIGNRMTRTIMKCLCGISVSDSQTGLRGIPLDFAKNILQTEGERFEYETNMLLETRKWEMKIQEIPIETVYIKQNRASHFRPLIDGIRIYFLLLKFCMASVAGFLVDISMYAILLCSVGHVLSTDGSIAVATMGARIVSAMVNYYLNHKVVFESKKKMAGSGIRYAILCILQMVTSAVLVILVSHLLPVSSIILKIMIDLVLFFFSFIIQRTWVF